MTDLISIGRSGVLAYQGALAAVGENVTNANNDGYAKRTVVLKEQRSVLGPQYLSNNVSDFNGVQQTTVSRAFDFYRSSDAWTANSDASYASTRSQYLTTVQSQLSDSDTGIGTKLTAIFTSANSLATNPTDTTLRQSMLYAVSDATSAIGQAATNLDKVSSTIADQASSQVNSLNTALQQLATINVTLKTAQQGSSGRAALEDQRDLLIGTISGTIGVDVSLDSYGAATLKLSNYSGPVLVTPSSNIAAMVSVTQSTNGRLAMTLTSSGANSAVTPTSGSLAGLIDAAGNTSDRKQQLDDLANNLATSLNAWQAQGTDANGNAGVPLLTGNTAETMALATNDPNAIAAATTTTTPAVPPATTDTTTTVANGNLLTLTALRGTTGVEATWHSIVSDQALRVSSATTAATTASAQKDNAYSELDGVSGVNLDNEAADLLRFQQAYSASTKIIQAAKDTFQTILALF